MKRINLCNVPDFKDANGGWVKTINPNPHETHHTRACLVWNSINKRCKPNGSVQLKSNCYEGCVNLFKDFQEFAEWCQNQYGYLSKDTSGRYWAIDKDLLSLGKTKAYSAENCIFVPSYINSLFTGKSKDERNLPLGVGLYRNGKYRSYIGADGQHLGYFENIEGAHKAWQEAKINQITSLISNDELRNHKLLVSSLLAHIDIIRDDINSGRFSSF